MANQPQQPPPVAGPEAGQAKPAEPGPNDPPGIAESSLPERKRDAARHPDDDAEERGPGRVLTPPPGAYSRPRARARTGLSPRLPARLLARARARARAG